MRIALALCSSLLLISVASQAQSTDRLVFGSDRDGTPEIYAVDIDGDNLIQLTTNSGVAIAPTARATSLSWSPDGQRIAFIAERGQARGLFIMQADGTRLSLLTDHPAELDAPAWSPDGQRIAFTGRSGDNDDIYLRLGHNSGRFEKRLKPDAQIQAVLKAIP